MNHPDWLKVISATTSASLAAHPPEATLEARLAYLKTAIAELRAAFEVSDRANLHAAIDDCPVAQGVRETLVRFLAAVERLEVVASNAT